MRRFLLVGLAMLAGLVIFDRARASFGRGSAPPSDPAADSPPPEAGAASGALRPLPAPPASLEPRAAGPGSRTPAIDLLARLEARRRLLLAAPLTYFDSLFTETDSVIRRWADPTTPLVVSVAPAEPSVDAALVAAVRGALASWENARLGVRFVLTRDSGGAQIRVRSTEQLDRERVGVTDLEWAQDGAIHLARIALARKDHRGVAVSGPMALAVAIHEIGHALGLSHSPNPGDVMYPVTRTATLSPRDRATAALLYTLPLGTVREVAGQ